MARAAELQRALSGAVDEAVRLTGAVGASAAVHIDGELLVATAGVTSVAAPKPVGPETQFRAGSIGKVLTTAGLLELLDASQRTPEARVQDLLPLFRTAERAEADLTVANLLAHTGGLDGDLWYDDFGSGDNAIARYVEACAEMGSLFAPGASWGYSNTGFIVAGRIAEVIAGKPFRDVLSSLISRVGLRETRLVVGATPADAANGHYVEGDSMREGGEPSEGVCFMPAGTGLFASPADLLRLAMLCDADAAGPVLPTAAAMTSEVVDLPAFGGAEPTHHGLGWKLYAWPSGKVIGHNGNGTGTGAFVRWDLDRHVGIALCANTVPTAAHVWRDVAEAIAPLLGFAVPPPPEPDSSISCDAPAYVGTYHARDIRFDVAEAAPGLQLRSRYFDQPASTDQLLPVGTDRFVGSTGVGVTFETVAGATLLHRGPTTARR